jgi:hypothetical protein
LGFVGEGVEDVGGDGEADQPWDRGRKQGDRTVRRVLIGGQVGRTAFDGGVVAVGELVG